MVHLAGARGEGAWQEQEQEQEQQQQPGVEFEEMVKGGEGRKGVQEG